MCGCCSVTEVGEKGGECRSEMVLHVGGLREGSCVWVKCKCTVHRQWRVSWATQKKVEIPGHVALVLKTGV